MPLGRSPSCPVLMPRKSVTNQPVRKVPELRVDWSLSPPPLTSPGAVTLLNVEDLAPPLRGVFLLVSVQQIAKDYASAVEPFSKF